MTSHSLVEAVSSEVVRKLRLASEAESKDDRETVLEEVFCDCTGLLDPQAQAQLGVSGPVPFYVVLAKHYASSRGTDTAVAVLHMLQGLYGQGYAAPLAALLLHRWLLLRPRSGGVGVPEEQRTRLAHVVALGAAQLFLGDVHTGATACQPLWHCLCYEVVLGEEEAAGWGSAAAARQQHTTNAQPAASTRPVSTEDVMGGGGTWSSEGPLHRAATGFESGSSSAAAAEPTSVTARSSSTTGKAPPGGIGWGLASLPLPARTGLLAAVAAFLVYYAAPGQQLEELLLWFPPPSAPPAPSLPTPQPSTIMGSPSSSNSGSGGGAAAGEGAGTSRADSGAVRHPPLISGAWQGVDFIMLEVVDLLGRIRSEAGLCYYLAGLRRLKGQPALQQPNAIRTATRLRLQGVLYALSSPGGPHYPPRAVRAAAMATLDALFPAGATTRSIVRTLFRVLHPSDWLGDIVAAPLAFVQRMLQQLALAAFMCMHSLLVWGRWSSQDSQPEPSADDAAAASRGGSGGRQKHGSRLQQRPPRSQTPQQQAQQDSSSQAGAADVPAHFTAGEAQAATANGGSNRERLRQRSKGSWEWSSGSKGSAGADATIVSGEADTGDKGFLTQS